MLLQRVEKLKGFKVVSKGNCTLAEGEVTGHAHRISSNTSQLVEVGGERFLINSEGVTLVHEEHKPVEIPPGTWKVGIVREYDWLNEMERQVVD